MRARINGPESQRTQIRRRFSVDTADPLVDEIIHERFRIEGKVGSGGMGNIYLAFDSKTESYVALKMIGDGIEPGSDIEKRLEQEAEAAMMISHENVVDILDIGRVKNKLFLVMEFLEGRDLKAELGRRGPLPWEEVSVIIESVCDALEAAHSHNIIHRDMKPENIFLVTNGETPRVKVIDFGLATFSDEKKRDLTQKDIRVGTFSYVAPEQIFAERHDHRADLYSFGAVIYELLTGRPPFTSNEPNQALWQAQILMKHKSERPKSLSEALPGLVLPKGAEDAIMKALEKEPDERHPSARHMKEAILGRSFSRISEIAPGAKEPVREVTAEISEFEILEIPEGEDAPSPAPALKKGPLEIPEPIGPALETDGMKFIPEGKKGKGIGRILRNVTVAGLIAAAAYMAYDNRERIMRFLEPQKAELPNRSDATPAPAVQNAPATFELRVQSEPTGASVYDITDGRRGRVYLGSTPLDVYLQRGTRRLQVVARGYSETTLDVSPEAPTHTVRLRRPRPRAEPMEPARGEEEVSEPPLEESAP